MLPGYIHVSSARWHSAKLIHFSGLALRTWQQQLFSKFHTATSPPLTASSLAQLAPVFVLPSDIQECTDAFAGQLGVSGAITAPLDDFLSLKNRASHHTGAALGALRLQAHLALQCDLRSSSLVATVALEHLERPGTQLAPHTVARDASDLAVCLAHLSNSSAHIWQHLLRIYTRALPHSTLHQLARLLLAAATASPNSSTLLDALPKHLPPCLHSQPPPTPTHISLALRALRTHSHYHPAVVHALCTALQRLPPHAPPPDLVHIATSLAHLRHHDPRALQWLTAALAPNCATMPPYLLSSFLSSLATFNFRDDAFLTRAYQALLSPTPAPPPTHTPHPPGRPSPPASSPPRPPFTRPPLPFTSLSLLAWSCAVLRCTDPAVINRIFDRTHALLRPAPPPDTPPAMPLAPPQPPPPHPKPAAHPPPVPPPSPLEAAPPKDPAPRPGSTGPESKQRRLPPGVLSLYLWVQGSGQPLEGVVISERVHEAARKLMQANQRQKLTVSHAQRRYFSYLQTLGFDPIMEQRTPDGLFSMDMALLYKGHRVAVEVDGPTHFSANPPYVPLGHTVLRDRFLALRGYAPLPIPLHEFTRVKGYPARRAYILAKLERAIRGATGAAGRVAGVGGGAAWAGGGAEVAGCGAEGGAAGGAAGAGGGMQQGLQAA